MWPSNQPVWVAGALPLLLKWENLVRDLKCDLSHLPVRDIRHSTPRGLRPLTHLRFVRHLFPRPHPSSLHFRFPHHLPSQLETLPTYIITSHSCPLPNIQPAEEGSAGQTRFWGELFQRRIWGWTCSRWKILVTTRRKSVRERLKLQWRTSFMWIHERMKNGSGLSNFCVNTAMKRIYFHSRLVEGALEGRDCMHSLLIVPMKSMRPSWPTFKEERNKRKKMIAGSRRLHLAMPSTTMCQRACPRASRDTPSRKSKLSQLRLWWS